MSKLIGILLLPSTTPFLPGPKRTNWVKDSFSLSIYDSFFPFPPPSDLWSSSTPCLPASPLFFTYLFFFFIIFIFTFLLHFLLIFFLSLSYISTFPPPTSKNPSFSISSSFSLFYNRYLIIPLLRLHVCTLSPLYPSYLPLRIPITSHLRRPLNLQLHLHLCPLPLPLPLLLPLFLPIPIPQLPRPHSSQTTSFSLSFSYKAHQPNHSIAYCSDAAFLCSLL